MIAEKEILLAVNQMLAVQFPQTAVYVNKCPGDFIRPSFFIEHVSTEQKDNSCKTVIKTEIFQITCFAPVDSHYHSDSELLMERQTDVLNLFRKGYIVIGDRAVKVKAASSGFNEGEAYAELQFEYCDDRLEEAGNETLIGSVSTKVKLKEGESWDFQISI